MALWICLYKVVFPLLAGRRGGYQKQIHSINNRPETDVQRCSWQDRLCGKYTLLLRGRRSIFLLNGCPDF